MANFRQLRGVYSHLEKVIENELGISCLLL
jgi:hypothetical protein